MDNPTDSTRNVHPSPRARRGRELDLIAITTSAATLLAPTGITEPGIDQLAHEILDRCPTVVLDPTAYVIQTLRRSGHEWERRAFEIAAGTAQPLEGIEF